MPDRSLYCEKVKCCTEVCFLKQKQKSEQKIETRWLDDYRRVVNTTTFEENKKNSMR
jgi:hypothetical protein